MRLAFLLLVLPVAPVAWNGCEAIAAESAPAAIVSRYRQSNGLSPVKVDPALTRLASAQAVAMARTSTLSHTVAGEFYGRLSQSGFNFVRAGENLGEGYVSFSDAMQGWIGSSGHRANLLIDGATRIGFSKATSARGRPYWVLVVAAPAPTAPKGGSKGGSKGGPYVQSAQGSPGEASTGRTAARREGTATASSFVWPFGLNPFNLFRGR